MGVRTSDAEHVCWYDSVSGTAFGPVFHSHDEADDFLHWVSQHGDPRDIREDKLAQHYRDWLELQADAGTRVYGAGSR